MTRAVMAVFTLFIVSLIVFTLMELVPGTCAERYLAFKNTQGSGITVEDIEPAIIAERFAKKRVRTNCNCVAVKYASFFCELISTHHSFANSRINYC